MVHGGGGGGDFFTGDDGEEDNVVPAEWLCPDPQLLR